MKVNLITHTPDAEKIVAAAAKLCYSQSGADDIMEDLTEENTAKFVNKLMELGHESPIEHVSFTFAVEGISRVLSHQLVRHRIGCSYSQQSQRYVKLEQFEYIMPPSIEAVPEAEKLFEAAMKQDIENYNSLATILIEEYAKKYFYDNEITHINIINYAEHMKSVNKKEYSVIEKKAIEDARYVFPNACETKIVFTMTARALFNFFHHRCCNRAQWEIREMAWEMHRQVSKVAPSLFKHSGPECMVSGRCSEGAMTCGSPYIRF
jgi:thymidylate synthase (FAD)